MTGRCRCLGASHGPSCPLLDYDPEDEEQECRRIEAELGALIEAGALEVRPWIESTPESVMRKIDSAYGWPPRGEA